MKRKLLELTRRRHAGRQTFDRQAPVYARKRAGLGLIGPGRFGVALHDLLPRGARFERALDVGGGTGLLTRQLALYARQVLVVDISPGMLDQARRALIDQPGVRFLEVDIFTGLPEEPPFDVILCSDVLHHTGRHRELIGLLAGLLAPGGTLLVLEYQPRRLHTRIVTAVESVFLEDIHPIDPSELTALCRAGGVVGRAHPVSHWEYLWVGTRQAKEPES